MPRQCATGPQYGAMPDPWSPAVRKYINDGLDDETLGRALGPTELPKQKGVLVPSYRIHNEAEEYKIRMGINKPAPEKYQKLNKEFSKRVADAYEQMEHNPNNPEVAAAYNALIVESVEQYKDIIANGLKVEFIPIGQSSPYRIPHEAVEDIISNRHMWVYSTRDGHGQGEKLAGNPLLAPTEFIISGQTALANDIFRVVHDYFGHAKDSIGFRAEGEENAFLSHSSMYSDQAQRALATETRGQNSWVNFGPMGEANRTASEEDTVFAEQKIGLLPEEFSNPNNPYSDGGFQPASRRNLPEDIKEARRIVNYVARNGTVPKDVADWRSERSADKAAREKAGKQKDELVRAAIRVREGKMTVPKFRELVEKYNPIIAITEVPTTASLADVVKALDTNKSGTKRILGLPNVNIKDGEAVSFRLDIPAYESYDVWVNTIRKEKQNYYSNIGVGNNAIFGGKHTAALKVASGHVLPSGKKISKSPFAVIDVAWENQNIEQTEQEIAAALQDSQQPNSTWKQIGFNPNRSGYFYDKATFLPVANASRVLQLGPLVMAQNVRYVSTEEANVNFESYEKRQSWDGSDPIQEKFLVTTPIDIKQQKTLNLFIDDEGLWDGKDVPRILNEEQAITKYGTFIDPDITSGVSTADYSNGLFMHRIINAIHPRALSHIKNWGVPAYIVHSDREYAPRKGAFYRAEEDLIFVRINPQINKHSNQPNQRDLEVMSLHEYGHFIHNRLKEINEGNARFEKDTWYNTPKFLEAFSSDGKRNGALIEVPKEFRHYLAKRWGAGNTNPSDVNISYGIDHLLNDFLFYDHMLHNPKDKQVLIDELNEFGPDFKAVENIIWASSKNVKIPEGVRLPTGGLKPSYIVKQNKGGYSRDFEQHYKLTGQFPTESEMLAKIQQINLLRQQGLDIYGQMKKRDILFEYYLNDIYKKLGHRDYRRGFYDILAAMSNGVAFEMGLPGHDASYYSNEQNQYTEVFANLFEAWSNKDQRAWKYMEKHLPELTREFKRIMFTNKNKKWTSSMELESTTRYLFNEEK